VASVGYRLSPKASFPAYIEDAAAAFAWTTKHVAERGGNPDAVFVGGHSAGGYLAYMVALDPRYLNAHGVELSSVAGAIPVSGQTMDHYTVRKERGGGRYPVTAGEAAPIYYCRSNTPPVLVLYADQDMAGRQAENEYLVEMMKGAGNPFVQGLLMRDRDHGSIAGKIKNQDDPARRAILEFMHRGGKPVH
jgi:acetyl esterase/lipase